MTEGSCGSEPAVWARPSGRGERRQRATGHLRAKEDKGGDGGGRAYRGRVTRMKRQTTFTQAKLWSGGTLPDRTSTPSFLTDAERGPPLKTTTSSEDEEALVVDFRGQQHRNVAPYVVLNFDVILWRVILEILLPFKSIPKSLEPANSAWVS